MINDYLTDVANEAVSSRGSQQRVAELAFALDILADREPRVIVEIGVHDAGTLWAWAQTLKRPVSGSQILGVDMTDENIRRENIDDLVAEGHNVKLLVEDSADPVTTHKAQEWLEGPIDFLFIDGDHHDEAIIDDYNNWSPLVSPTGIIGFHDTLVAGKGGWDTIVARQADALTIEIARRDDAIRRTGIGLVVCGTARTGGD